MTGRRCQLCDGAISKGRCKVCGMPYRRDVLLYHPNESRQDHYKHAAPKAKEIMKEYTVSNGAKNVSGGMKKTSYGTKNTSSAAKNTFNNEKKTTSNGTARTKAADRMEMAGQKNKKKGMSSLWWVIILFYIIVGFLSKV